MILTRNLDAAANIGYRLARKRYFGDRPLGSRDGVRGRADEPSLPISLEVFDTTKGAREPKIGYLVERRQL